MFPFRDKTVPCDKLSHPEIYVSSSGRHLGVPYAFFPVLLRVRCLCAIYLR